MFVWVLLFRKLTAMFLTCRSFCHMLQTLNIDIGISCLFPPLCFLVKEFSLGKQVLTNSSSFTAVSVTLLPNIKHQWPICTIGSHDTAGGQGLWNRH